MSLISRSGVGSDVTKSLSESLFNSNCFPAHSSSHCGLFFTISSDTTGLNLCKNDVWYAASTADPVPWVNKLELVPGMKKMDRCISRSNPTSWILVGRGPFVYIRKMFCASGNEPVFALHNNLETLVPWCSFTTMLRCFFSTRHHHNTSGHVCRGSSHYWSKWWFDVIG